MDYKVKLRREARKAWDAAWWDRFKSLDLVMDRAYAKWQKKCEEDARSSEQLHSGLTARSQGRPLTPSFGGVSMSRLTYEVGGVTSQRTFFWLVEGNLTGQSNQTLFTNTPLNDLMLTLIQSPIRRKTRLPRTPLAVPIKSGGVDITVWVEPLEGVKNLYRLQYDISPEPVLKNCCGWGKL